MTIEYLPGWRWHYRYAIINGKRVQIDRWATDPQGNVYNVRQLQNEQRRVRAEQGQPKEPPQPRRGRRYTRKALSERHGRVTEIYFDSIDQAQEWFQNAYSNKDPRVMPYENWYIQVIYTALVAQRDTNTAKQVPRTITYTERGVKHTRRVTQERAALSTHYNRIEDMGLDDEPWNDARQREGNFTIKRVVLFGAER